MIPAINFNQKFNQSFQGLNFKNVAIGKEFIQKDIKALEELGKHYNIKISQGTEYLTDGSAVVSQPCLDVLVTPLKRKRNPFVRLFNIDGAYGTFQLAYRKSRQVEESVIGLVEKLVNIVSAKSMK